MEYANQVIQSLVFTQEDRIREYESSIRAFNMAKYRSAARAAAISTMRQIVRDKREHAARLRRMARDR